ncbi:MAG: Rieske 2Fe-2S domain-containing protein [Candidatus Velthaea sp.]
MLSRAENELLTHVTGDAPMGRMMRRYWVPAALAEEVAEPDGAPVSLRLFGEELVVFRDTHGRVGLVDANCPHRLASLRLARNEECGLRCVYHGWKFDVEGKCLEMPTEPEGYAFRDRMRITAYPTREAGGIIWAYMGPPGDEPPFPAYDFLAMPAVRRAIVKMGERANYLQALEGSLDSSHTWFLHRGTIPDWEKRSSVSSDLSPVLEAEDTEYGFRYAAIRKPNLRPGEEKYVRVTLFVLPFTAFIPRPLDAAQHAHVNIFVPVDDEHTMFYDFFFTQDGAALDEVALRRELKAEPGADLDSRWFRRGSVENGWNQDRAAMKRGSWLGIEGFQNQDMACQESMGTVVDRTREHLGTSDVAIIRLRRRMLDAVRRFQNGKPLIGHENPIAYERLRSEQKVIPIEQPWQTVGAYAGEYATVP